MTIALIMKIMCSTKTTQTWVQGSSVGLSTRYMIGVNASWQKVLVCPCSVISPHGWGLPDAFPPAIPLGFYRL
ncbi:hypothetical protein BD779DRAFT_1005910 [Infundibulicybe gibba]|nr:hypothetical protein BD779DRAFT_1005910 [Infundibulicybe gibba]